jgi:ferritin-like protein
MEFKVHDLAGILNSLMADEYIAREQYEMMKVAAKGTAMDTVVDIFDDNGDDEFKDHYAKLVDWAQSNDIDCVVSRYTMEDICNCPFVEIDPIEDTSKLVHIAIEAEKQAIAAYEQALEEDEISEYKDLMVMIGGILTDERGHLLKLKDVLTQIEGVGSAKTEEEPEEGEDDAEKEAAETEEEEDEDSKGKKRNKRGNKNADEEEEDEELPTEEK